MPCATELGEVGGALEDACEVACERGGDLRGPFGRGMAARAAPCKRAAFVGGGDRRVGRRGDGAVEQGLGRVEVASVDGVAERRWGGARDPRASRPKRRAAGLVGGRLGRLVGGLLGRRAFVGEPPDAGGVAHHPGKRAAGPAFAQPGVGAGGGDGELDELRADLREAVGQGAALAGAAGAPAAAGIA